MNRYPAERSCPLRPPPEYARWREEAPVTPVVLPGGRPAWLVTRYDDVRRLLRHPALSSDSTHPGYPAFGSAVEVPPLSRSLIGLDGAAHERLRRVLGAEFSVPAVARMQPELDRIVDRAVDGLLAGPVPADLVERFALPVASRTICHVIGLGYESHEVFEHNTHVLTDGTRSAGQKAAASAAITALVADLVGDRRRRARDDLASRLVTTGGLTDEEVVDNLVLLVAAGHDTSANMLALSAWTLLDDPAAGADFLAAGPQGQQNAVEELLRFHSIIQLGLARVATADIEVGDRIVRAGEGVVLGLPAANADPRRFTEPDTLDLARADARRHLAFGFGPHQCLGHYLARTTLRTALAGLLGRLPGLRLADEARAPQIKDSMDFHGLHRLPVHWETPVEGRNTA
ncbi:cytochrome P450 [Polymorphospora sp. NPDC050346]|uniref:cytochrome P450 n=1 Tax=Polymorphospora sp. NPDC050346 TaxID=3155780 RepID=UPI00340A1967